MNQGQPDNGAGSAAALAATASVAQRAGLPNGTSNGISTPQTQQIWNNSALSTQQQHQLLLQAAKRQNLSFEELRHLTPSMRANLVSTYYQASLPLWLLV